MDEFHWMMPSKRSSTTNSIQCMIPYIQNSTKWKLTSRDRKQMSCCLGDETAGKVQNEEL